MTEEEIPECDCCMWDDEGYIHEPNCSFRIWVEDHQHKESKSKN